MKLYPHETWLKKNSIELSECPDDIQKDIANFEEKFGDIDPDDKHEAMSKIMSMSKNIASDLEEHFQSKDLEEDLQGDELNEFILSQSNPKTTLHALNKAGFNRTLPVREWVVCGDYAAIRESHATNTVTVKKR